MRHRAQQAADRVFASGVHAPQLGLLTGRELGLAPAQPALGAGDRHALAGGQAQQVDLELGEGARMLKNILPIGSVGS